MCVAREGKCGTGGVVFKKDHSPVKSGWGRAELGVSIPSKPIRKREFSFADCEENIYAINTM
jgi:hypothetical protein